MSLDLTRISRAELESLANAFQSGRLTTVSGLDLQKYIAPDSVPFAVAVIEPLLDDGMTPRQVAHFLRAAAIERRAREEATDRIELVWTGPEAVDSASRDTGVVVRELFEKACSSVLVAGFAVHHGAEVFRALAENMDNNPQLYVRLFLNIGRGYRDTTLEAQLVRRFAEDFRQRQWSGKRLPQIWYDPRALVIDSDSRSSLHAKCVVVDRRDVFITSANFTQAAQRRNIELGALIRDEGLAQSVCAQFERLIESGLLTRLAT